MKKFTTYSEIENLCEAMIKDFMKRKHYTNAHCVDIEAFVTEYLGIPIVYETFAEPDPGRIGFLSDGIRPLWVVRGNEKKQVLFPKNTVVLEKYLQTQTEIGRKRSYSMPIPVKRCDHFKIRLSGFGNIKLYSIAKSEEEGSAN